MERLSIHYRTVENHRTNICRKLGLEGGNALVRYALQNK
ncbi:MAG TPA: LuxR C-terminal-related transcriptional regulator [Bryobacteraceae bacterium]|nr:LuxR C-terminal-related transcriptional regulator [Bryobacteraceae bacterium]